MRAQLILLTAFWVTGCTAPVPQKVDFSAVSRVPSGKAYSVMLTSYSTTLIADGFDHTGLRIAVMDSASREITSAIDSVRLYVLGEGKITHRDGTPVGLLMDTAGVGYYPLKLEQGLCEAQLIAGSVEGKVKVEARVRGLWPGSHEIHLLPAGFKKMEPDLSTLKTTGKKIDRMIGADISWLPELESQGKKFLLNGVETDPINLLKQNGFNYIRLRIFVDPGNPKGYSPGKGFCGLAPTLAMAKRVANAGMKLLLDFHYSDYWADPQQQFKPLAWSEIGYESLKDSVRNYTKNVLLALKAQGTFPAMVQIGNEINHGMLWPDGHISNPDGLAGLLKAGISGTREVDPDLPVMLHIALGGQNQEARFWLDNMIARGVTFDIIGISYYPRWHGTLEDLHFNLNDLSSRYQLPINVVEYSNFKKEVHDIVFSLPDNLGKGAAIWEPLNAWSGLFDHQGNATGQFSIYQELNHTYLH